MLSTDSDRVVRGSFPVSLDRNIFGESQGLGGPFDAFFGDSKSFFSFDDSTFFDVESGESDVLPPLSFFTATLSDVEFPPPTTFFGELGSSRIGIFEPGKNSIKNCFISCVVLQKRLFNSTICQSQHK